MIDTPMLKSRIDESGLKRAFIASKLGISRHALYQKINNITEFNTTEVSGLCELLGVDDLNEKEALFFAKRVDD